MTATRRDGNESAFSHWIRSEPMLDSITERLYVCDVDYWVHQYRAHKDKVGERLIDSIMLVELKTFASGLPFGQRDTLKLVNAGMREAFYGSDGRVKTIRHKFGSEVRLVRMYGAFLLQLSSDRPDTSEEIIWHGRQIDLETLVDVLSFKRDPRTLRRRDSRRHHLHYTGQAHPQLFSA